MIKVVLQTVLVVVLLILLTLTALALAPSSWLANRAEDLASYFLDIDVTISKLDIAVFSATPGFHLRDLSIAGNADEATIELQTIDVAIDLRALITGTFQLDIIRLHDGQLSARIDQSGQGNWQYLLKRNTNPVKESHADEPSSDNEDSRAGHGMPAIPRIRQVDIRGINLQLDDRIRDNVVELNVEASGSTVLTDMATTLMVSGDVDGVDLALNAGMSSLAVLNSKSSKSNHETRSVAADIAINASLGSTALVVEGTINDIQTFQDPDIIVDLRAAQGLDDVQKLTMIPLPLLPPFAVSGDVLREGDEWILRRFSGSLGDSDIGGDLRFNPAVSPPRLYANLASEMLDLDDLAGLLGASPDTEETATESQLEASADAETQGGRLLPDTMLVLKPLTEIFDGALEYRAANVSSPLWPLEAFDVRIEINGQTAEMMINQLAFAGGTVNGGLSLTVVEETGKGEMNLQVKQIDLRTLLASAGLDTRSVGELGGEVKLWFTGNSVAQIAASADGGAYLLMNGGELDALLVELLGIDLSESLSLFMTPGSSTTAINCAFVDLQSRSGVVDIATLVLDTDDTVLLADGSVDLGAETLDVKVEPHPKDVSIMAAQTAVSIGGSFSDISILPGAALVSRAAAAAVLATIISPVAAIIPFIDAGSGTDSSYCSGMVTALDDAQ